MTIQKKARAWLAMPFMATAVVSSLFVGSLLVANAHAADPMADGTVKRLNLERGTITLQHGPIPALEMPPMTMTFKLQKPEIAQGLKAGDAVKFQVIEKDRDYVVTEIEQPK